MSPAAVRATVAVATIALAASCSGGGRDVISADDPCTQDETSLRAKDTIERVGGLRTDDWAVGLAMSTRGGVIALVTGDVERAWDDLHGDYGVSIVARDDHPKDHAAELGQLRDLLDAQCE